MKKVLSLLMAVVLVVAIMPSVAMAQERINWSSRCSLNPEIKIKEVVGIEVIDGEVYIDVIEDEDIALDYSVGPCKSPYKYTTKKVSRSELVDMGSKIRNDTDNLSLVVGFIIGIPNPVAGLVTGYVLSSGDDLIIDEIDSALKKNKNQYTIKTKLKCEEGNMGSRGIVHRYKIESVTIS